MRMNVRTHRAFTCPLASGFPSFSFSGFLLRMVIDHASSSKEVARCGLIVNVGNQPAHDSRSRPGQPAVLQSLVTPILSPRKRSGYQSVVNREDVLARMYGRRSLVDVGDRKNSTPYNIRLEQTRQSQRVAVVHSRRCSSRWWP